MFPVAIVATCPYCRKARFRLPDKALGLSATCPKCRSSFTVTDAEPVVDTSAAPESTVAEAPITTPAVAPSGPPPLAERTGLGPALVGLICFGLAGLATQFPYGRFVLVGMGVIGFLAAAIGLLMAEGKKHVPLIAMGLNALAVLIGLALPGVLGLEGWQPPTLADDRWKVRAAGFDGGNPAPAEWVDASRSAWLCDDVKVSVPSVAYGPVELGGPKGAKRWSKERSLQIRVRLTNSGVERKIDFLGWSPPPAPNVPGPTLTDAQGKKLNLRRFDGDWKPDPASFTTTGLFPGKSAEDVLYFEPPGQPSDLKLELPGAPAGTTEPIRLTIPRSMYAR